MKKMRDIRRPDVDRMMQTDRGNAELTRLSRVGRIQRFTEQYNVTDAVAAEILGVCPGNISNWRSGLRSVPTYIIRSIDLHLSISKAHQQRLKEQYK